MGSQAKLLAPQVAERVASKCVELRGSKLKCPYGRIPARRRRLLSA